MRLVRASSSKRNSQAAVDFMTSYGVAILIVAIAIYVIVRLGIFSNSLAQPGCVAAPSFSCSGFVFNQNGLLTFLLAQNTGGEINITGVACSQGINVTGNLPQYGNVWVLSNSVVPAFYPSNALTHGLLMYSDASNAISIYCYGSGGVSSLPLGVVYTGYVWINYTYTGLPNTYHSVERVFQFSEGAS